MRAKTRTHRIAAALCAVPFFVLAGAGAASAAAPATAPAVAPTHVSTGGWHHCDDWGWDDDCGYYGHGYDYGYDGFAVVIFVG